HLVVHRLEGANRTTELLALPDMVHCHLQNSGDEAAHPGGVAKTSQSEPILSQIDRPPDKRGGGVEATFEPLQGKCCCVPEASPTERFERGLQVRDRSPTKVCEDEQYAVSGLEILDHETQVTVSE